MPTNLLLGSSFQLEYQGLDESSGIAEEPLFTKVIHTDCNYKIIEVEHLKN